jgi:poly-gamma-glutamate synthesis protein (capsule biosynthesis protein)
MYNKNMKHWLLIICAALLLSCAPSGYYVRVTGAAGHAAEHDFINSFFEVNGEFTALGLQPLPVGGGTDKQQASEIVIEFHSSWESQGDSGDILISRTFLVPREDPVAGRTDTTLNACLDNEEILVPPYDIAPPYVALRVDGLTLEDEGYPLIRLTGVTVRFGENAKLTNNLQSKMDALIDVLKITPYPGNNSVPEIVWITSGGDVMLDRGASDLLFRQGPAGIFGKTAVMLKDSDLAIINLEGVVSRRGEKTPKSFNFRFVPEVAPALKNAGIDAVLHANNHVYDFGATAFLDSLNFLKEAKLGILGAGTNDEEASTPFIFTKGDQTFRVMGIASFPRERNGWDGVTAAAGPNRAGMLHSGRGGIEKLKSRFSPGDPEVNIIVFHGGTEWSTSPDAATRTMYTDLIKSGADLLIGSHPHVVQGFEWVLGKPVFWSLGNYVFGGMENTVGGEEGLFIKLGYLNGQLLYLEPFALTLTQIRTDIAPAARLKTYNDRTKLLREQNPLPKEAATGDNSH